MSGKERIYGLHAVRAALLRHPERIRGLQIGESRDDGRVAEILELARRHGLAVKRIDSHELKRIGGDLVHQGVLAEVDPLPAWSEDDLLEAVGRTSKPLLLALDGVQDPHNLGACLRTADACGALAVIVPRDRAAQLNPAARKVAAGAAETTPVVAVTNLARTLKLLKEADVWAVGADMAGEKRPGQVDLKGGIVLVLGAEGAGLRQLTRQSCDFLVQLPMRGAVESLNVSVAAGMLLYEAIRQREGLR